MGNSLSGVVSAIPEIHTQRAIVAIGLEMKRLDRTLSTVIRNNEAVTSYATSGITFTAGAGLTGGGDLSANRTFAVGAGFGIAVAADAVAVDQTMVPTWTGIHTFSAQDVHNAGVSLGTSGVMASAKTDTASGTPASIPAGIQLNLTATRPTDDIFRITNTADGVDYMQISAKGEFGFGRFPSGAPIYLGGQLLGFALNTTSIPTLTGGVAASVEHSNSGVSPAFLRGLRGCVGIISTTSGTGSWAGVVGNCYTTGDPTTFSARELSAFLGNPGLSVTTNGGVDYGVGINACGDWKRMGSFRAAYWRASGSLVNRPKISYGACLSIPGYSATAANSGEQHGLEILADVTTPATTPLTSCAATIAFPFRGTNKAHLAFIPTAASAGGPTWAATTISGSSLTTGKGGVYFDEGTNNPYGLYQYNASAWQRLLSTDLANPLTNGGASLGANGLGWASLILKDTAQAFETTLQFTDSTPANADRTLTVDMTNVARTVKLTGNPTLADWFDQDVKTTGVPQHARIGIGQAADGTVLLAVNDAVAAPSTTATPVFTAYYGGNTNALGDPLVWLRIRVGGTTFKFPGY